MARDKPLLRPGLNFGIPIKRADTILFQGIILNMRSAEKIPLKIPSLT